MPTPNELVTSSFAQAQTYANDAKTALTSFTNALNGALYTPPTLALNWTSLSAPTVPTIGTVPTMPTIAFTTPSGEPAELVDTLPEITIDDFTDVAPTVSYPVAPTLTFGTVPTIPSIGTVEVPDAPILNFGTAPTIPDIGAVTVPTAPTITMPNVPTYLSLNTITFGGIDVHASWLSRLETIPELTLASPTPYSYVAGPEYASELLDGIKAVLTARLAGGSGLAPAVEQAIWDRARSRETQTALGNEAEIMRNSEAMGFQLPAGVLAVQLREAQQAYYDKLSTLSRDISIKQAELEQENLKQTIAAGMDLEGKLIDYSYKLEELTFQTAKAYADNAIQIYNAGVEGYKALMSAYQIYASAYKTVIDAELAKVEVYKAELSGEQTKAQINSTLVQQYKAQIDAGMSQVEIYKAQVGAAQTLIQLEQAKIGAAGEQIRAFVAQVNAETSKVEAYKAQVGASQTLMQIEQAKIGAAGEQIKAFVAQVNAETSKVEAYRVGVQAESTKMEVYKAQAQVYSAKASAQAEKARAEISRYGAIVQAKSLEWDGWKAKVAGETARIQALGTQSTVLVDGFKAGASATEAQATLNARTWESNIKQYEAGQQLAISTAKLNGDFLMQTNNARLDAAKAGAQVYAQLTSSAYSMIHATAGVTASAGMTVGYSYSNDTTSQVSPVTSI